MSAKKSFGGLLKSFSPNIRRLSYILIVLLVMITILKGRSFWSVNNFQSMFLQLPEFGILSFCLMLAYTSGGVDLSVVGTANSASIVAAMIMLKWAGPDRSAGAQWGIILLAIAVALMIGAVFGLFNGVLVGKVHIPAMLATLGTEQLFFGIAKVITKAETLSNIQPRFTGFINQALFRVITVPLIIFVIVAAVVWLLINRHHYGFRLFMTGQNPLAAEYSGISVDRTLIQTYMLSGVMAALAGLLMMARTNSMKANYGNTYLTQAILTSMLGGTAAHGGYCTVGGVVLAIFVMQMLSSVLNMFPSISNFYRGLMWGLVLLVSITLNHFDEQKSNRTTVSSMKGNKTNAGEAH